MRIEKPFRVKHSYVQRLMASPEDVFPLLCPVREVEWVDGWMPNKVISDSGIAELHCVFTIGEGKLEAMWVVTEFDPEKKLIAFVKVTPGVTVANISIQLRASENSTLADVTYMYTALSPEGEEFVRSFTQDYYINFMKEWESELNYFLRNKKKLSELKQ